MSDEQEHGSEYFSEDSATLMEISNDVNFVNLKAAKPEIVSNSFNSRIVEDGLEGGSKSNTSRSTSNTSPQFDNNVVCNLIQGLCPWEPLASSSCKDQALVQAEVYKYSSCNNCFP